MFTLRRYVTTLTTRGGGGPGSSCKGVPRGECQGGMPPKGPQFVMSSKSADVMPFLAGILNLKRVLQRASENAIFIQKNLKKFMGNGTSPFPDPYPCGRGHLPYL